MIHSLNITDIDIAIGASYYNHHLIETQNIRYYESSIYFLGFIAPLITLSQEPLELKYGILPKEPLTKLSSSNPENWTFSTCPIKMNFQDSYFKSRLKSFIIPSLERNCYHDHE